MARNLQARQERQRHQKEKMLIYRYQGLLQRCQGGRKEDLPDQIWRMMIVFTSLNMINVGSLFSQLPLSVCCKILAIDLKNYQVLIYHSKMQNLNLLEKYKQHGLIKNYFLHNFYKNDVKKTYFSSTFSLFFLLKFDWIIISSDSLNNKNLSQQLIIKLNQLMKTNQDSFEECKRQLEESLGISSVVPPTKPMNPYMRFFLERSSEERSKGRRDWNIITKELTQEWKALSESKKEFFQKIYEVRLRERNALFDEYNELARKRKPVAAYGRYVKKRYAQYKKQYKNSTSSQINKMISADWAKISTREKKKLEDEYKKQVNDASLKIDNSDRIDEYAERLQRYHNQLNEDKEKVLKKYGLTKQNRARLKRIEKDELRRQKQAQRVLQRQQLRREAQEKKQLAREANRKRQQEERDQKRRQKEQQRQKQKERLRLERQQKKADEAERKRKQKEEEKLNKAKKDAAVKQQTKQVKKGGAKSKSKAKKTKKAEKTKKIKKLAKKAVAKAPVKKQVKQTPKQAPAPKKPATKAKPKTKAKAKPTKISKSRRAKK